MNHRRKIALFVALATVGVVSARQVIAEAPKPHPHNQAELDAAFASRNASIADWNAAGHAFDNQEARLYWFTDLEAAKAQAKREKKPILSLRLLGKLSDEYSCANSRFFRVIFYPQSDINKLLRQKFILFWSSERPVPIVTIDMGDGRVLKRTLTGNSAHYLLDSDGQPLDVMPGLVTPMRFQSWLEKGVQLSEDWNETAPAERQEFLMNWHRAQMSDIWREVEPRMAKNEDWINQQVNQIIQSNPLEKPTARRFDAAIAAPIALSKVTVEAPILDGTRLFGSSEPVSIRSGRATSFKPLLDPIVLDDATRQRIKAMNSVSASDAAESKKGELPVNWTSQAQMRPPDAVIAPTLTPSDQLIRKFENAVRADDRLSLERLQIPIHANFVAGGEQDFSTLNRKIYGNLFLTPQSDPWLGLSAQDTFTGLQNGGIVESKASHPQ